MASSELCLESGRGGRGVLHGAAPSSTWDLLRRSSLRGAEPSRRHSGRENTEGEGTRTQFWGKHTRGWDAARQGWEPSKQVPQKQVGVCEPGARPSAEHLAARRDVIQVAAPM